MSFRRFILDFDGFLLDGSMHSHAQGLLKLPLLAWVALAGNPCTFARGAPPVPPPPVVDFAELELLEVSLVVLAIAVIFIMRVALVVIGIPCRCRRHPPSSSKVLR